uniref:Uncharacterized protein n=1 Tax=Craspedostauros australis TaxID=1486917 RepID=A0A7R9WZN6_9STRA|mmetsp:Transcript_2725/g.7576  ORF Transcript_2725/g.7576 Transcript_2725/m.7576 type:complete len:191 (+) Transcript_2725:157-729(+)
MTTYIPANAMFEFPDGEIVTGAPGGGGSPSPRMKEGQVCCGSCCDMRRAVIIVNIVMVTFLTLNVFLQFLGYELVELAARESDASEDTKEAAKEMESLHIGLRILFHLLEIAAYSFAIRGAIKFERNFVLIGFCAYIFSFGVNLLILRKLVGAVLTAFFAYPHYFLAKEIEDNIMTPENYPNEVHSCCCA